MEVKADGYAVLPIGLAPVVIAPTVHLRRDVFSGLRRNAFFSLLKLLIPIIALLDNWLCILVVEDGRGRPLQV
jgi:hypothetical protein